MSASKLKARGAWLRPALACRVSRPVYFGMRPCVSACAHVCGRIGLGMAPEYEARMVQALLLVGGVPKAGALPSARDGSGRGQSALAEVGVAEMSGRGFSFVETRAASTHLGAPGRPAPQVRPSYRAAVARGGRTACPIRGRGSSFAPRRPTGAAVRVIRSTAQQATAQAHQFLSSTAVGKWKVECVSASQGSRCMPVAKAWV